MQLGIENRLALITGASRGIGKAIANSLASEGARLVLVARQEAALRETIAALPGGAARHTMLALDLMSEQGVDGLLSALHEWGTPEIIVHNLGGSLGMFDPFADSREWARVWQFNLGVAHDLNRALLPAMQRSQWGRIVHLSTLSTTTYNGNPAYVSAKCAVDGYVKSMNRLVSRDNVIISAVAPGAIYSEGRHFARLQQENPSALADYFREHLPIQRLGQAEDIGPVVTWLCSEYAAFMAGSIVSIDGGGM